MSDQITLFCWVIDSSSTAPFSVSISASETVDGLKDAIKAKKGHELGDFDADALTLWKVGTCCSVAACHMLITIFRLLLKVSIPFNSSNRAMFEEQVSTTTLKDEDSLSPVDELSDIFPSIERKHVHVLVRRPAARKWPTSSCLLALLTLCILLIQLA